MLESLDHVIVAVRDLDAASGVYSRLLGREPSWRGSHPRLGTANTLKLRERGLRATDPVAGEGRDERGAGLRRWRNVHLPPEQTRGVLLFAIEHGSPADALPDAVPTSESGVVRAIDHVVIRTADPEATIALYGNALGLRLALDRTFEERGVRLIFFRVGGVTVEVAARAGADPDRDVPDEPWGIAWQVDDVVAAQARLRSAGFDVSDTRAGNKAGTRVCSVRAGTHGVPTLVIGPDPSA